MEPMGTHKFPSRTKTSRNYPPPQLPVILDYRTVGLCTLNTLKSRTFCQASAKPGTSHLPRTTNAENTQVTHPVHNFYKRVQNKSQSVHIHTVVYTHLSMSMSLCMYVYVHIYIYTHPTVPYSFPDSKLKPRTLTISPNSGRKS